MSMAGSQAARVSNHTLSARAYVEIYDVGWINLALPFVTNSVT